MIKLDYLTLLCNEPVFLQNVGHIKPPKIIDVKHLGFNNYNMFISILNFTKDKFVEVFNIADNKKEYFDLIFDNQYFREMFKDIFSFFMCEKIKVDTNYHCYVVYTDNPKFKSENDKEIIVGVINKDTFEIVKDLILQFNYCKIDDLEQAKPAGKHTAELLAKREKYKKKFANSNGESDSDISLPNIVSKVSAYSCGINLLNVWDYTVFQIFDQFFVLNSKQYLDMANLSHSVWGGEYKVPEWYKNTFEKSK